MLSFFGRKKIITEHNQDENQPPPIQGPTEPTNNGDEFIFVERRNPINPPPAPNVMYPPMPNAPGGGYSRLPYPYNSPAKAEADSCGPVPYLEGVPFVLAPQLAEHNQITDSSTEVDRILAILTRQMSVDEELNEYNFTLEKSVLSEM